VNRRELIKRSFALAAWLAGRQTVAGPSSPRSFAGLRAAVSGQNASADFNPESIVVGSGAGGGTVAARLAELGFRVLLLEAGGDPRKLQGADPQNPGKNALPEDYDVPAFHSLATENEALRWDFFVRHYKDDARQHQDKKFCATFNERKVDGVLYPRAGTLGGCTAHNAMIFVYPHNSDWDQIADITGDPSWRADHMRTYFERIEDCRHRWWERVLSKLGRNPSRHGWGGWLPTERAIPLTALKDGNLRTTILKSAKDALRARSAGPLGDRARIESQEDPNDWRVVSESAIGLRYAPMTTDNHSRVGTRERLLDIQSRYPGRLKIELNALATRVLFDEMNRATGVEYLSGERLYRAHAKPSDAAGAVRQARASRAGVLAGGVQHAPTARRCRGSARVQSSRRTGSPCVSISQASGGTCRIATRSRSSTACPSMRGRPCAARRSPGMTRSSRSGRTIVAASSRPTASCSRSSPGPRTNSRSRICSATA
jgi:choline dehydrogenase-like flavoprotein